MIKQSIACDLDDVLWDMVPAWCNYYNMKMLTFGSKEVHPNDLTEWDISKFLTKRDAISFYNILKLPDFWDFVIENQDKVAIKNTKKYLHELSRCYNLYITTATDYGNKHKLDLFTLVFGGCVDKNHMILIHDKWLLDVDIAIDDKAETLEKFNENGVRCIKIEKPWNTWYDCETYIHFNEAAKQLLNEV